MVYLFLEIGQIDPIGIGAYTVIFGFLVFGQSQRFLRISQIPA